MVQRGKRMVQAGSRRRCGGGRGHSEDNMGNMGATLADKPGAKKTCRMVRMPSFTDVRKAKNNEVREFGTLFQPKTNIFH